VAQYIITQIEAAIKIHQSKGGDFNNSLDQIWPRKSGRRYLPANFPKDLQAMEIRFSPTLQDNSNGHLARNPNGGGLQLSLSYGLIQNAKDQNGLQNALKQLEMTVYHETDHIYNPGSDFNTDATNTAQETIRYLSNPGEMRAHAWQYAVYYAKQLPNQPFNLQKIQQLAQQSQDGKAINYFISFADPQKQSKYQQYGNVKNIHDQMVQMTSQFVGQYNQSHPAKTASTSTFIERWDGPTQGRAVVEIIQDPSMSDVARIANEQSYGDAVGAIVTNGTSFIFRRDLEFHKNVANQLHLSEYVGVLLSRDGNEAMVTDSTSRHLQGNPIVVNMIQKQFPSVQDISFFDEAINGDWRKNQQLKTAQSFQTSGPLS